MDMRIRPRRLRGNEKIRRMVRETRMDKSSLIYPLFVMEGENKREEIPSMPGQYRYTLDILPEKLSQLADAGVGSVMLFGIPDHKDEVGSGAYAEEGIVQRALRRAKIQVPDLYYITDVCMCEYTSHGHCGVLCGQDVDNDKTLELLAKTALSHVQAGADMVAPSDMMDGRVLAIRETLDQAGYAGTPIMSYAVKYASAFYGPLPGSGGFRSGLRRPEDLPDGFPQQPGGGQGSPAGCGRGGRDIVMVKPAMSFLDMVTRVRNMVDVPVAAYSVSGEYAMVKAAAQKGWIDEGPDRLRDGSLCIPGGSPDLSDLLCGGTG